MNFSRRTENYGFMDYLIGGIDQTLAGNGGPDCVAFRSDQRKVLETLTLSVIIFSCYHLFAKKVIKDELNREKGNVSKNSKQLALILYCLMMGIQIGFKFATRTLIFGLQPCHVISSVQIYLLATPSENKWTSIIYKTHVGLLNGPLLAILFPVLDTYSLPFEVEMYFIQHWAILLVPVYLYALGEPYSHNSWLGYWLISYPVFLAYHMFFLQPISMYTGVNISTTLCPVTADPFYGPNYILQATWHQGLCIFLVLLLYSVVCPLVHKVQSLLLHQQQDLKKETDVLQNGNGVHKID